MGTDTRRLLDELRDDHRNIAMVLDFLERAVYGDNPDFEMLEEIMRYMTVYPDAVHHPKEDVVFAALKKQRPDLAAELNEVREDHRRIAALGSRLREDIEAIIAGAAVRRSQLTEDCSNYVHQLRSHMEREENDLYGQIESMISGDSRRVDVNELQHIKDPVFELEIEAGFRRLIAKLEIPGNLSEHANTSR